MQHSISKSAMQSGLIMGGLFSANFLLSVLKIPYLGFLSFALFLGILYGLYKLTVRFRDKDCEGQISYWKAFSFIILTFFYAALISTVVKFLYFQLNPGYLETMFQESMKAMEMMKFPMTDETIEQMQSVMQPLTFSLQYIWINVLMGTIVGLIMSAFIKKEKNIFENN